MMYAVRHLCLILVLTFFIAGCGATPSKEKVSEALKPIMPQNFAISSVEKLKSIDGLYEVVVVIDNQPTIIYLDSKLKHVVSGSVVEIASKKNLTYETQMKNKAAGQSPSAVQQPASSQQKIK